MNVEHANRAATAIPADAPEYVKKRIELRRAGKRKLKAKAKATLAPVVDVDAATDDEQYAQSVAVLKAALEQ